MSNWGPEEDALAKLLLVADQYRARYGNSYREVRQDTKDMHTEAHTLLGSNTNPKSETFRAFEELERAILTAKSDDRADPNWSGRATNILNAAMQIAQKVVDSHR